MHRIESGMVSDMCLSLFLPSAASPDVNIVFLMMCVSSLGSHWGRNTVDVCLSESAWPHSPELLPVYLYYVCIYSVSVAVTRPAISCAQSGVSLFPQKTQHVQFHMHVWTSSGTWERFSLMSHTRRGEQKRGRREMYWKIKRETNILHRQRLRVRLGRRMGTIWKSHGCSHKK